MFQKQTIVVVLLVILVPLAGCAGSDDAAVPPETETTTTMPTQTSTATTTTSTPTLTATPPPTATTTTTTTPTESDGADSPIDGGEARTATVTRVIDGDTVEVEFSDGETDTIRLLGVDTPETIASNQDPSDFAGIPDTTEGRDWLLNWGEEAKVFAQDQLAGEQVTIVTDPESDERGSFGRLLAYIYIDGENFNQRLLEDGLARMYDSSFSLRSEFSQIEETARSEDRGLWAFEQSEDSPTPTEPPARSGDQDCGDFDTQQEAQEFFGANNPDEDPHRLDADGDGVVCESLP